jgi:hypothetical protein
MRTKIINLSGGLDSWRWKKKKKKQRRCFLDGDKRYRAPVRRRKVIRVIAKALGWRARGNNGYFLFRDGSKITTDETGHLKSSGGKATKAFFKFQVWNIPLQNRNPSNQGATTQREHTAARD